MQLCPSARRLPDMRLHSVRISAGFCILLSILLLTVPLKWLCAALIAAAVHEAGHVMAICLLKKKFYGIEFGFGKTQIFMENSSHLEELLTALAGPMAGILLIQAYRYAPRIAICAALQTAYNCLPLYPLDGGRAVYCLSHLLFGKNAAAIILRAFRYITVAAFILTALMIAIKYHAWSAAMVLFLLSVFAGKKNTLQTC